MKINKIKINKFGNLENKELEFDNNINVIYGKNESGKSTLLKFITSMLYGLSKNKNGKLIPDMDKYTPWEDGDFSGKIYYELNNGKKYEIYREFKKKNAKIFDENSNDISKEFNIDKTKGIQFFYDQVKIDEDLFLSTIVSEQQQLKLDKQIQTNLIQKTANLLGTGDDSVSFNKIISKLNKRQTEEIGSTRTLDRPINVIEKRLKDIKNEITEIIEKQEEKEITEKNKEEINKEISKNEIKLNILKEIKNIKETELLEKEKININKNYFKEFDNKIEQIESKIQANKSIKEEKIENKNKVLKNILIPCILIIISIVIFILSKKISLGVISGGIVVLYLIINFINNRKIEKKIKEKEKFNKDILEERKRLEKELEENKKIKEEKILEMKKQEDILNIDYKNKLQNIKNTYQNKIDEYELDNIIENSNINLLFDRIQNKLNEDRLNLHKLNIEEKNILDKLEKLAELKEEENELKEKYNSLQEKNELINSAKIELTNAYEEMRENISPKLTSNLSQNIASITNEKYKNVKIDDNGNIMVENQSGNYINIENLSIGTIEQLYLSLRFSFAEGISKEKLPIMLDEAFAYFDDTRLINILKFLNNKFTDRQIFIFTCTKREQESLEKLNIGYNLINL